jgi:MinD-like ATPase involved in chromosome partitioning or flagellar assembly
MLHAADLHEILCPGPAGVLIAPRSPGALTDAATPGIAAQLRFLGEIKTFGDFADVVVIDAGPIGESIDGEEGNSAARIWLDTADESAYVCTPTPGHITATYAGIKQGTASRPSTLVHLVVNKTTSLGQGLDAWNRVKETSAQFLGVDVAWLGGLPIVKSPADELSDAAAVAATPEVEAMSTRVLARIETAKNNR